MNPDKIFIRVNDRRVSLTAFAAMDKATIKTVYASGCTALTGLDLPAAEYVYARGCTALTGYDYISAGENERGYDMFALRIFGSWRIIAGCRYFTIEQARRHWSPGSSRSHSGILARVEKIATQAAERDASRDQAEAA